MKSYLEFCAHYGLDPDRADARGQYRDYRANAEVLLRLAGREEPRPGSADILPWPGSHTDPDR